MWLTRGLQTAGILDYLSDLFSLSILICPNWRLSKQTTDLFLLVGEDFFLVCILKNRKPDSFLSSVSSQRHSCASCVSQSAHKVFVLSDSTVACSWEKPFTGYCDLLPSSLPSLMGFLQETCLLSFSFSRHHSSFRELAQCNKGGLKQTYRSFCILQTELHNNSGNVKLAVTNGLKVPRGFFQKETLFLFTFSVTPKLSTQSPRSLRINKYFSFQVKHYQKHLLKDFNFRV